MKLGTHLTLAVRGDDRPHHAVRVVGPDRQAVDAGGRAVGAVGGGDSVVAGANVWMRSSRRGCECQVQPLSMTASKVNDPAVGPLRPACRVEPRAGG